MTRTKDKRGEGYTVRKAITGKKGRGRKSKKEGKGSVRKENKGGSGFYLWPGVENDSEGFLLVNSKMGNRMNTV